MGRASIGAKGIASALAALLLASCAGSPVAPPPRREFPGAERDAAAGGATGPSTLNAGDDIEDIDAGLFAATEAALARGDWLAATLALPAAHRPALRDTGYDSAKPDSPRARSAPTAAAPSTTELRIRLYAARIALLRGDAPAHSRILEELAARALTLRLQHDVLQQRLLRAELNDDAAEQVALAFALAQAGGHPQRSPSACLDTLWAAAQNLDAEARAVLKARKVRALTGWIDLAALRGIESAAQSAEKLAAWLAAYPGHAAAPLAGALQEAARRDALTRQLALLLPLSGPLAGAGDALVGGFLAAWYADTDSGVAVDVLDSRRFASAAEGYRAARERGASLVVGPLDKGQVDNILAAADAAVPVLALNRATGGGANPAVLKLSLAPEDEAQQLARIAFAAGQRRALLVRPEGAWGERMQSTLRARWSALGGRLSGVAIYAERAGYSNALRAALALDTSAARARRLGALFPGALETSERRRADLDAVFLLTRNSAEARAFKPLLDYHYAGDLPVYSLSTALSTVVSTVPSATLSSGGRERRATGAVSDLDGIEVLTMPWRAAGLALPGLEASGGAGSDALHALGADAYRLARRWWRSLPETGLRFDGLTAHLAADRSGSLQRTLNLTEFDRGRLLAR